MNLLFLTAFIPLAGYLFLSFSRGRLSESMAAIVGVGTVGISALIAAWITIGFLGTDGAAQTQLLWHWIDVHGLAVDFALRLDELSLVMLGIVTGVGFFIHLYASWYMRGDKAYARFFSYMNLFVASMLFLVLGDNLLVLYLGWEGVGVSSYLLIGFWYQDSANGAAARKAFVITRAGDVAMSIALFILILQFGTLDIDTLMSAVTTQWEVGAPIATLTALLLLGGAVGKSAQLPLQTWLPDAMAGPTPVSALIHAATMVTAGVYLIARTHALFELSPVAMQAVGVVGAATLLLAGFCALAQTDIKRVLAYSTMSQIGYMFLALGVGAWQAAVFHLMTHAFFKALLFLGSGSVILAMHHEQDMFKMGGLRKSLPFVFGVFLIGSLALVAIPPTAGFFSKDEILHEAYASGHTTLWACGLFGAFLTAVYTFRMLFITFFGAPQGEAHPGHGLSHHLPLAVLAILAVVGGFIHLPLDRVLPASHAGEASPLIEYLPLLLSLTGIALAAGLWLGDRRLVTRLATTTGPLRRLALNAMGFDWLYDRLFVKPYLWFVHLNRNDLFDQAIGAIPATLTRAHHSLSKTQTGQLRWYAASVALGAVLITGAVFL